LSDDLRVRFRFENDPVPHQLRLQLGEVLDDPVMDDRRAGRSRAVGVGLVRPTVGRPACVADADRAREWRLRQLEFEVVELALGATPLEVPVLQGRDASRVVSAIF
jgi:hypothetical protein